MHGNFEASLRSVTAPPPVSWQFGKMQHEGLTHPERLAEIIRVQRCLRELQQETGVFPRPVRACFAEDVFLEIERHESADILFVNPEFTVVFEEQPLKAMFAHEAGHLNSPQQEGVNRLKKVVETLAGVSAAALAVSGLMGGALGRNLPGSLKQAASALPPVAITATVAAGLEAARRSREEEMKADRFAARATSPAAVAQALSLSQMVFEDDDSGNPLGGCWSSHPPLQARIEAMRALERGRS